MPGMLFGLNVSTQAGAGADPVAVASKVEQLGFDFVSASDHLHGGRPTDEPWTMLSWIAAGPAELRAAARGRAALEAYLASSEFDPELFTPADHAALAGSWSWLGQVAGQALEGVWVGWSTTT